MQSACSKIKYSEFQLKKKVFPIDASFQVSYNCKLAMEYKKYAIIVLKVYWIVWAKFTWIGGWGLGKSQSSEIHEVRSTWIVTD